MYTWTPFLTSYVCLRPLKVWITVYAKVLHETVTAKGDTRRMIEVELEIGDQALNCAVLIVYTGTQSSVLVNFMYQPNLDRFVPVRDLIPTICTINSVDRQVSTFENRAQAVQRLGLPSSIKCCRTLLSR